MSMSSNHKTENAKCLNAKCLLRNNMNFQYSYLYMFIVTKFCRQREKEPEEHSRTRIFSRYGTDDCSLITSNCLEKRSSCSHSLKEPRAMRPRPNFCNEKSRNRERRFHQNPYLIQR